MLAARRRRLADPDTVAGGAPPLPAPARPGPHARLLVASACASEADGALRATAGRGRRPATSRRPRRPRRTGGAAGRTRSTGRTAAAARVRHPRRCRSTTTEPDGDTLTLSIAAGPRQRRPHRRAVRQPGRARRHCHRLRRHARRRPCRTTITEHFDIVGVDPRGLGASDIDCGGDCTELYGVDYSIDSPEDTTALLDVSQRVRRRLRDRTPATCCRYLGTDDVARDIDAVRAAMGDEQLNYLGFSYGTAIGQMLADLFPDRVRAMVIDGVARPRARPASSWPPSRPRGSRPPLPPSPTTATPTRRARSPPTPSAPSRSCRRRVEQAPIPAPAPRPRSRRAVDRPGAAALQRVAVARAGRRRRRRPRRRRLRHGGAGRPVHRHRRLRHLLRGQLPRLRVARDRRTSCWPPAAAAAPSRPTSASRSSTTTSAAPCGRSRRSRCRRSPPRARRPSSWCRPPNDPATPYEAGVRTAERLESGVLLTYEGEGHTVVGNGVACVDDIAAAYLVDLEPPEDGTTC